MTEKKTVLERMYPFLKKTKKLEINSVKKMSDELGCSLAYISQTLKMIRAGGLASLDIDGNTKIIHPLPAMEEFIAKINEENKKYRESIKGTGTPRKRTKKVFIPEEFEINEKTIIPVLTKFFIEFRELKEKTESERIKDLKTENDTLKIRNEKLIKYVKILKSSIDEITE